MGGTNRKKNKKTNKAKKKSKHEIHSKVKKESQQQQQQQQKAPSAPPPQQSSKHEKEDTGALLHTSPGAQDMTIDAGVTTPTADTAKQQQSSQRVTFRSPQPTRIDTPSRRQQTPTTNNTSSRRQQQQQQQQQQQTPQSRPDVSTRPSTPYHHPSKKSHIAATPPPPPPPQKPRTPIINTTVHRLRSLTYLPSAILRLHTTTPSNNLVTTRDDGSITLTAPHQNYRVLSHVAGVPSRPVDAVTSWQDVVLGGSRDGTVFEIDFGTGGYRNVWGSGGGSVLCLERVDESRSVVAVGCEDGGVRILEYGVRGGWVLMTTLMNSGACVLSLACHVPREGVTGRLYVGCSDGSIRLWEDASSSAAAAGAKRGWKCCGRISVEGEANDKSTTTTPIPTRIWALCALTDGTIASGDSLGHVQLWDGTRGTLVQSFRQNENNADVFDIAVSGDGLSLFASGVDSKVVRFRRGKGEEGGKWFTVDMVRKNSHDVRSLTICRSGGGTGLRETLIAGGVDCKYCLFPVETFEVRKDQSIIYPRPNLSPVTLAREARVLALRRNKTVDFYKLAAPAVSDKLMKRHPHVNATNQDKTMTSQPETHMGTVEIQTVSNLVCAVVNDDATLLAVSDALRTMLFELRTDSDADTITATAIALPEPLDQPSNALVFTARRGDNSLRLVSATNRGPIHIISITHPPNTPPTAHHEITLTDHLSTDDNPYLAPPQLAISTRSEYLSILLPTSTTARIDIYSLNQPTPCHHWTLPDLSSDAPPTTMRFLDGNGLLVAGANKSFYIFSVEKKTMGEWSTDAGFPVKCVLPDRLEGDDECPTGLAYHSAHPETFIMGFHEYFLAIDLDRPIPCTCETYPPEHLRMTCRQKQTQPQQRRGGARRGAMTPPAGIMTKNNNFTICLRYNGMLFLDYMSETEMVIVQQPWLQVVDSFPDALERKIYGY